MLSYIGLYVFYAFTQASICTRFLPDKAESALKDFLLHFAFAPLVLGFFMLTGPVKLLEWYANTLRGASE